MKKISPWVKVLIYPHKIIKETQSRDTVKGCFAHQISKEEKWLTAGEGAIGITHSVREECWAGHPRRQFGGIYLVLMFLPTIPVTLKTTWLNLTELNLRCGQKSTHPGVQSDSIHVSIFYFGEWVHRCSSHYFATLLIYLNRYLYALSIT